ncbi:MAG TPA: tRNA (N6-isopentenyl adenosine(37)-C2)-methylthiotransferase MiaB [Bacteroidales bacterium]|nr:tRNA (N6-isopentenyl adenosine(37)-C2)-methylthiotransferase MiaB [Bacteroidales bacterium]
MTKKLYIETYGCQMNYSDSEIVASVMTDNQYSTTENQSEADVIFLNTCSIRDNAEQKVLNRLKQLQNFRKKKPGLIIGVLGCMAERLKNSLLEEGELGMRIDMVVGPDSYRDLPQLMFDAESGHKAIDIILSAEETYADITPVRFASNGVSAFISIMRGCENFCSYCVVPFTRGKERSRDPKTILAEARELFQAGYREVTLLGQNVNSYKWEQEGQPVVTFPSLIELVAGINPHLRLRFATSHPKDLSDELLHIMSRYPNICKSIHLPMQSGSTSVLDRMNRKYSRHDYLSRIDAIRRILPDCAISTDIIAGFCGETDQEHAETLEVMEVAGFDFAYMFKYSEREGTMAAKKFANDVPEEKKSKWLQEIIRLQQKLSLQSNKKDVGKSFEVLVEGKSKRSAEHLSGRNSQNKVVVFPSRDFLPGDYVLVKITSCTAATLLGEAVAKIAQNDRLL